MAKNDYTEPTQEQMEYVLDKIAGMANTLNGLCISAIDSDETDDICMAASMVASQIGWMADRCTGFKHRGADGWFLSSQWNNVKGEVQHD